ncbi:hypothetical protein ENBRE01_0776 [Enteropsectra breve]|nr:hypothetical protein ENBRE01_0776 [Enteropsectra breve]
MFKRLKIAKKEEKENTFKSPKIKKINIAVGHEKENSTMEKVFALASIPMKRATLFRFILQISNEEIEKNIYMIAEVVLNTLLEDINIHKNFYAILRRLIASPSSGCLEELFAKYLIAQLRIDKNYLSFAEWLFRNASNTFRRRKQEIEGALPPSLADAVRNLKCKRKEKTFAFGTTLYITRKE